MNQPATPATPSRLGLASIRRPAPSGAAATAAGAPTPPAAPEAAPEQGQRKGLTARLRDAKVAERSATYSPTGEHLGAIVSLAVTKSGNGVQCRVKHADGESFGSLNFNLMRIVKDAATGAPITDPETGLPKTEPSIGAWRQWEAFCSRYGIDAAEALDLVEQGRAAETGILGLTERWKWSQSGDFLNVSMPLGEPGAASAAA